MNLTHTTCHSASTPSYSDENCKLLADQQTTEGGLILEGMFGPRPKEQPELESQFYIQLVYKPNFGTWIFLYEDIVKKYINNCTDA